MSYVQALKQLGGVTCVTILLTVFGGGTPASIADPSLQPRHGPVSSQVLSLGDDADQGVHTRAWMQGGDDDDDDFNIHSVSAPGDDDDDDFHAQFFPRSGDDDDDGVNVRSWICPPSAQFGKPWHSVLLVLAYLRL